MDSMLTLKKAVVEKALDLGAAVVGCAPVGRWAERGEEPEGYRPADVWPGTRTVVTFGVPLSLAALRNSPSIPYRETQLTTNRLLDEISLRLATWLIAKGYPAMNLPYSGRLPDEQAKFRSIFSHVFAAWYAGLGCPGLAHTLVTRQWGPRIRFSSVLLAAELPPDSMLDEDPCTSCNVCAKRCPTGAITPVPGRVVGELNKELCGAEHKRLTANNISPCGICLRVCPVGEDRKLFRAAEKYMPGGEVQDEHS